MHVRERLTVVVPLTLAIIFVLLYLNFRSVAETGIILLLIPFRHHRERLAALAARLRPQHRGLGGHHRAGGPRSQTGTVMIIYLDEAFHAWQRAGRMKTQHDLFEAITYGTISACARS